MYFMYDLVIIIYFYQNDVLVSFCLNLELNL